MKRITIGNLILVFLFGISTRFFAPAYSIPSGSMEPTLVPGNVILTARSEYGTFRLVRGWPFHKAGVDRGDMIVFSTPPAARAGTLAEILVKRVIALEGDTVSLSPSGAVHIDGSPTTHSGNSNYRFQPFTVPTGHVWVMGDNRDGSYDSRYWGPVPVEAIKGVVTVKLWPPGPTR